MDRREYILYLIDRYKVKSYIEIGCQHDYVFNSIPKDINKFGIDPTMGGNIRMTSDYFFEVMQSPKADLIFIDGLHTCQQVMKDITNSIRHLNKNGIIVCHDCSPNTENEQRDTYDNTSAAWCGTTWKAFVAMRTYEWADCACGDFDYGCGTIVMRPNTRPLNISSLYCENMQYEWLDKNREEALNLKNFECLCKWLPEVKI